MRASVAVYITVFVPNEKQKPLFWLLFTEGVLQLSLAVGAVHVAVAQVAVAFGVVTVIFAGQADRTGG